MRRIWSAVGWVVFSGLLFSCGSAAPPPQPLTLRSLGAPVEATLGRDGGVLQVEANGHVLRLEVPPTALAADTTLTLEPVAVDGLDGVPAVRFGPAGQTFALPATLVVSPPPPGARLVGLHFDEDAPTGTLRGVAPLGDGATMLVSHFSGAAVGPADALAAELSPEAQALLDGLADDQEAAAFGLAERLALAVEPAVAAATRSVVALLAAESLFAPWATVVQRRDLSDEGVAARGETFGEAVARLEKAMLAASEALTDGLAQPACTDPSHEVRRVRDWLDLFEKVQVVAQRYGTKLGGVPCARGVLSLSGPQALQASDDALLVDVRFELEAPDGTRELEGPLSFVFRVEGAATPETIRSVTGVAEGVRVERPAAPRPPAVRVTVAADLFMSRYPELDVEPVVLVASEPLGAIATATPASVGPGQTAAVCVKAFASGQPVSAFDATFSTSGPGRLDARDVRALTGDACVTYTAPATPQSATVSFRAKVAVNGATTEVTTTLALTTSAVQVAVTGPTTATVGAPVPFTATVTGATNPALTWSASGGTISPTGEFSATSSGSYVITATSVEDPVARGQITVTVSCAFPDTPLAGDDRASRHTQARGLVLSSGQELANEVDTGTGSATVEPLMGDGYSVSASASATATSVTARASATLTAPVTGDAQAEAESISRIATISGTGTGRVRLTATVQGSTGADGFASATLEFDPFDDVGGDSVTFERGVGSGPTSFSEQLVLETTFEYSTATSLYARLATRTAQDGNLTVTLTSASVVVDSCQ